MSDDTRDVIEVLEHDHREVEEMFARFRTVPRQDSEERQKIADQLVIELVRHAVAEEQYLYPASKAAIPGGAELVEHEIREHAEAEQTMNRLDGLRPDDEDFDATVFELEAQISHHIAEEEGKLFPALRANASAEELRELGAKVEAAKKIAPTRPHPMAPDRPPLNKLLGPGTALVDRIRDLITGRGKD